MRENLLRLKTSYYLTRTPFCVENTARPCTAPRCTFCRVRLVVSSAVSSRLSQPKDSMRRPRVPSVFPTLRVPALSVVSFVFVTSFAWGFNLSPGFARSNSAVRHNTNRGASRSAGCTHRGAGMASCIGTTMVAAEPIAGLLKTVTVDLEDRSYPIYIGTGILDRCDVHGSELRCLGRLATAVCVCALTDHDLLCHTLVRFIW